MSVVPKETIEVIAQSIGMSNLSPEVALALASDVEYRMREIMQDAIKCMRHSKRTILTANDVDIALNLRNVEPIYGFASGDSLRFERAVGHKDLFYLDDEDVEFKDVIEAPIPKAPLDTAVVAHWLAIEGVQPAIPENAPVEALVAPSDNGKPERKEDGLPVEIKLPIKHVLSRELQLYFDKIRELTLYSSDTVLFKEALASLATDSGLHPLVPHFTHFVADKVTRSLNDFPLLFALMRVVRSLLQNPHIRIEPYLHQVIPRVLTCLVTKRLGNRLSDNHWELRNFTADLLASICKRFGHVYYKLQQLVTDILLRAFLDPTKAMTQHYGAIKGLACLGPGVVRLLILPNLEPYLQLLEPEMLLEKQKNEMKRNEAWHVYGALLCAAGQCMYDRLKLFPSLLSPTAHTVWRTNGKVVTAMPNKRKMSVEHTAQQPLLKRVKIEGSMGGLSAMTMQTDNMQATTDGYHATSGDSVFGGPLQSFRRVTTTDSNSRGSSQRQKGERRAPRMSATVAQAWKEDMDTGDLLASLFNLFGESILPFKPSAELSFFL